MGQNGLHKRSYLQDTPRRRAFAEWDKRTRFYFEARGVSGTVRKATGTETGTLMEVMKAAERIHCSFLVVHPPDVLKGTPDLSEYDPEYEEALKYGVSVIGRPVGRLETVKR